MVVATTNMKQLHSRVFYDQLGAAMSMILAQDICQTKLSIILLRLVNFEIIMFRKPHIDLFAISASYLNLYFPLNERDSSRDRCQYMQGFSVDTLTNIHSFLS